MPPDPTVPLEVEPQAVKERLASGEDVLLLDCREADEHGIARIDAARLLPMSEITDRMTELLPYRDRAIVVHCHRGGRSLRVTKWLREQGFDQAQSMEGGIDRWSLEIDPAVPRY